MRHFRKATGIRLLLLLVVVLHATGCASVQELPPAPRPGQVEPDVRGVVLRDSTRHRFDRGSLAAWEDSTLVIREPGSQPARFPAPEIRRVVYMSDNPNAGKMVAAGLGLALGFVVWIALFQSAGGA